jgi:hypothetical protein
VSFLYVLACRLFELLVLLGRGDRSKELETTPPIFNQLFFPGEVAASPSDGRN